MGNIHRRLWLSTKLQQLFAVDWLVNHMQGWLPLLVHVALNHIQVEKFKDERSIVVFKSCVSHFISLSVRTIWLICDKIWIYTLLFSSINS